uniref:Putative secreted protein n=1 Tax=Anopheles triannulatus TaxID=58253 RepID=A0A2M4B594_9DIPT
MASFSFLVSFSSSASTSSSSSSTSSSPVSSPSSVLSRSRLAADRVFVPVGPPRRPDLVLPVVARSLATR